MFKESNVMGKKLILRKLTQKKTYINLEIYKEFRF